MSAYKDKQNGFTIVEVVVAIALAGIAMIGLVVMVTSMNNVNNRTNALVLANSFAESEFEDLRSASFAALSDGTYDISTRLPVTLGENRNASYIVSSPTTHSAQVNTALKKVDLTISYTIRGKDKVLNYSTYIGELGVGQY
jgi:prepilin-type N-terminal cleavage/methylation domain-containing protein